MADKKAKDWAEKNPWFGKDQEMTDAAFKIHADLVNEEKIDPSSEKYYNELDKRIKKLFPPITNKKQVLECIINGKYESIPKEFYKDKSIVLEAVKKSGYALKYADQILKKDKSIVLEATKQFGLALEYADETLKKDKSIVLEAVKSSFGHALQFADVSLKKDKSFILEVVKTSGIALQYADESLKKNKSIVLEAVKQYTGALEYADASFKKNKDFVLNLIKNHNNYEYIDYVDENFLKDKDFVIKAVSLNRSFLNLLIPHNENLIKDIDIFNLIKEGKAKAKLYSKELYECLKYQLPEHELLCFFWSGGDDSFHGYQLLYEKKSGKEITKTQIEQAKKTIIKELFDDCLIVEEMNLELGCAGEFYSQGGLVVALKPLSEIFQWNVVNQNPVLNFNELSEYNDIITTINLPKNFSGFSLNGQNSTDLGFDEEKEETNWDITPVGKQLKI